MYKIMRNVWGRSYIKLDSSEYEIPVPFGTNKQDYDRTTIIFKIGSKVWWTKTSKTQDNYSWHFSPSGKYMTPFYVAILCKYSENVDKSCPNTPATTGNLISLPFWTSQQLLSLKTRLRVSEEETKQQLKFIFFYRISNV